MPIITDNLNKEFALAKTGSSEPVRSELRLPKLSSGGHPTGSQPYGKSLRGKFASSGVGADVATSSPEIRNLDSLIF